MSKTAILWFRRDLRLEDNPALQAALAGHDRLLPVYIHSPDEEAPWTPGAASNWWRHHSLAALDQALRARGSRLLLLTGDSLSCLRALIAASGARALLWNRRYEPAGMARDTQIKQQLRAAGMHCESHNASLLFEPWELKTSSKQPFRVFTAFWRRGQARLAGIAAPVPAPRDLPPWPAFQPASLPPPLREQPLDGLNLLPRRDWDREFYTHWQPGETAAQTRLAAFFATSASAYANARDHPALPGTTRLSAHLHHGDIGPRQILSTAQAASGDHSALLRELGWREFSVHLLYHFPRTAQEPLNPLFLNFPWRDPVPEALLRAWQRGQTGIPLVDAGMRELWQTGWMHNRVRMIVASFLTKNLRIPWQMGARWFWDTLVDADLANNTQGWQWTAGCGADAAPYFRIFNPVRQAQRFDPQGNYVRRWCPELARLPTRDLHQPWKASVAVLQQLGVELGRTYPSPIVDPEQTRTEALAFWQQLRETDSRTDLA